MSYSDENNQVDPVALGIPHYNDIVPKENMRDLSLIQSKLEKDQFPSVDAFEADIKLMTYNAILFNGQDSPVSISAKILEKMVANSLKEFKNKFNSLSPQPSTQTHKRASSTTSESRSNKKSRIN